MRITEALEKGHPRLTMKGVRSDVYAFVDDDGVFKWNHTNMPVRAKLLTQDWFPYEPEKCEADILNGAIIKIKEQISIIDRVLKERGKDV